MKKLKATVIGIGNMGLNHLRVYSRIPEVEVVGICDLKEERFALAPKDCGGKAYSDFRLLLDSEKPHMASVCVPTSSHYEVAEECIRRGIHVLLEKPITDSVEKAEKLLAMAEKGSVKFLVGHIERFNPVVIKAKEIVESGRLGKIIAIISRRVGVFPPQISDVNVSVDLAIHDIDISNYLLGEMPKEVQKNQQRNLIKKREDSVEFFLKYGSGASAYIQANWITPVKIRKMSITGSRGYLELDYIAQEIDFYESHFEKDLMKDMLRFSEPDTVKIIPAKKEPLEEEIQHFIRCITNDIKIDSQFAVDSLKIALMK